VQKRHQLTNVVDAVPRLQPAPDLGMVNDHTRLDRAAYATGTRRRAAADRSASGSAAGRLVSRSS
jgi:hypothetical protein